MALLSYVIKIKKVLFSKLACCVYQVTFFCMKCPIKRRGLFEKTCLKKVVYTWKKLFTEKIIMSHNAKYYVKSLKVKSHIIGLWMKKYYSEENIVHILHYTWYTDRYCNWWFWLCQFTKSVKKRKWYRDTR